MTIDNVLSRLDKVRQTSKTTWKSCCPVHEDKNPSLSITDDGGKILLYCFGCGARAPEIVSAIGLEMKDLFPDGGDYVGRGSHQHFNWRDAITTLKIDLTAIAIGAQNAAQGALDTESCERLALAASRIRELIDPLGK